MVFRVDDMGVPGVSGGTASAFLIGADAQMLFSLPESPVTPFLLAGGGLGVVSISDVTIPGFGTLSTDSESKPYLEIGGGVDIKNFFAEVKYVAIFTSDETFRFFPLTVGVKF